MFKGSLEAVNEAVEAKKKLMQSGLLRYIVSAMLAGAYVGFGIMLIFTVGGSFKAAGSPAVPLVMGMSFGIALTLVIFAGSELFTGNNMLFTVSSFVGKDALADDVGELVHRLSRQSARCGSVQSAHSRIGRVRRRTG